MPSGHVLRARRITYVSTWELKNDRQLGAGESAGEALIMAPMAFEGGSTLLH
jgi:hypothetical protein